MKRKMTTKRMITNPNRRVTNVLNVIYVFVVCVCVCVCVVSMPVSTSVFVSVRMHKSLYVCMYTCIQIHKGIKAAHVSHTYQITFLTVMNAFFSKDPISCSFVS